jgi:hypothetical protein
MTDKSNGRPIDILLVEDNPADVRLTVEAFKDGKIANRLHVTRDQQQLNRAAAQRDQYRQQDRPAP